MSFAERIIGTARAREILGVDHKADAAQIRAAWKRVAFQTHPDRNGGQGEAFENARAAYALLLAAAPAPGTPPPVRPQVHRPRSVARTEPLSDEAAAACARLLQQPGRFPGAAPRPDLIALTPGLEGVPATDHVPATAERLGRDIVFVVAGALAAGVNRVAIPGAEFRDRRKIMPRIVVFSSAATGTGEVTIPREVLQKVVPGARSVTIRFTGAAAGAGGTRTAA